jgi:hypothetical protein
MARRGARDLKKNGGDPQQLVELMIGFDDGPTYEIPCRGFRVEES